MLRSMSVIYVCYIYIYYINGMIINVIIIQLAFMPFKIVNTDDTPVIIVKL